MDISTTPVGELSFTDLHNELINIMEAVQNAGGDDIAILERRRLLLDESKRRERVMSEAMTGKPKGGTDAA